MPKPHIELIARGVLIHNRHLLICQNRQHGHLFLPGGHVEFGEPAAEALQREIQEEMGIHLAVGTFLGACEASFQQRRSAGVKRHHELNLLFQLLVPKGFSRSLVVSREDHIKFIWIKANEAVGLPILPMGISEILVSQQPRWMSLME